MIKLGCSASSVSVGSPSQLHTGVEEGEEAPSELFGIKPTFYRAPKGAVESSPEVQRGWDSQLMTGWLCCNGRPRMGTSHANDNDIIGQLKSFRNANTIRDKFLDQSLDILWSTSVQVKDGYYAGKQAELLWTIIPLFQYAAD